MKILVKSRKALIPLILGASLVQFSSVGAAPMQVTATVNGVCQLGAIGNVAFGPLNPGSGDASTTGSIQWRCTNGTNADVAIDNGLHFSGNRVMAHTVTGPTSQLAYQLYKDVALTQVWSDSGTDLSITGTGFAGGFATETVYAEVLAAAIDAAEVGDFADTVDVTITVVP